jgi:neutral ceramidase
MRWLMLVVLLGAVSAARAGELRAGAAAVVITPANGTAMAGYYTQRLSSGVDNDLYAKALVIEQDGTKLAMVSCDLIRMPRKVADRARELVQKSVGIGPDHLMLSSTHCHTAPCLPVGDEGDSTQNWDLKLANEYVEKLPALIAKSVEEANAKLAPARAFAGTGHEETLAFNRRYVMTDGSVGWNPGKLNPKVVRPAGPTDPDVPVVYFESPDGTALVTYTNFALHLDTVGGTHISADFPYTLHSLLNKIKGPQMVSMFTIGAAGDINHVDVRTRRPQSGEAEAARIGTILAGEVLKTYARMTPVEGDGIHVADKIVALDLPPITAADIEEAHQIAAGTAKTKPKFLDTVKAYKVLDVAARNGKPQEAEVQVFAIGNDLAWVSIPGELFTELGMSIKRRSPFAHTIVVEMANANLSYIPTRRAFEQGNYEPISARSGPGSGEKLVETAVEMLEQIHKNEATTKP